MTLERLPRPIRLMVRIDVQHDPHDLAPVGTFRIGIEQTYVGDGMHFVATKRLLLAALSYAREQERRIELLVTEIDKQQDDIAATL
jgi:hypothetical protein